VVEGLARVVHSVDEAAVLEPGEILIAPVTDVGWSPYFRIIGGLATDVGSSISHGAVVAREYGLPAVVNLGSASRSFHTGDHVRLDANRGTLRRLDV
jgi:pyruvate,water dikinase